MYSCVVYAASQGLIEVIYVLAQTVLFGAITYSMLGLVRAAGTIFIYIMFLLLTTYFTFYGMMVVGVARNRHVAAIISSLVYSLGSLT